MKHNSITCYLYLFLAKCWRAAPGMVLYVCCLTLWSLECDITHYGWSNRVKELELLWMIEFTRGVSGFSQHTNFFSHIKFSGICSF